MKTKLFAALITLACLAGILYIYPHYISPGSVTESVLIDKTDSFLVKPKADEITSLLQLQESKWKRCRVRIQAITDFKYNTISSTGLPSDISIINNPSQRDKEVEIFKARVAAEIDSVNRLENELQYSCVYSTLVTELNKVASIEKKQKIVIVYSDLMEHSPLFNIYNPRDFNLLKANQKEVKEKFEKAIIPDDLHGVQVFFVFKPRSTAENTSFELMSGLFKSILEEAGAQVSIGANLSDTKGLLP